jgi:hypothetical protein
MILTSHKSGAPARVKTAAECLRARIAQNYAVRVSEIVRKHGEPEAVSNAIGYAKFRSRSHGAVIRVYDAAGNVIETHEQEGRLNRKNLCHKRIF